MANGKIKKPVNEALFAGADLSNGMTSAGFFIDDGGRPCIRWYAGSTVWRIVFRESSPAIVFQKNTGTGWTTIHTWS